MFESVVVGEEDVVSCADGLVDSVREVRLAAARRMARVASWADLHCPAPGGAGVVVGGDGSPAVTPFAATELGCLLQTTTHSARSLLADALDLRHRHPRCWQAVMTGQVEDFKARHVARATRAAGLSRAQARRVDAECVQALVGLAWGRAMLVLEAAVVRADPAGHERRRAEAEQQHYVATSKRDTTTGLRTLIARTTAGDFARLEAMITHLADLLRRQGDNDDLQLRRTKAVAILADPAHACLVLTRTHTDPDDPRWLRCEAQPSHETPEPEQQGYLSAVHAAAEVGRLLLAQGATALARLRPRSVVYLHLTHDALRHRTRDGDSDGGGCEGVARVEDLGPVSLSDLAQLRELLGHDALTITPVIDHRDQTPVDAYETPATMREALTLRHPYEVFPWGTLPSRGADCDHTTPYRPPDEAGPPGQTRPDNLGPLARGHHNAKTHGGFTLHQPTPGTYLWRTPSGHWYQVDHHGTTHLGRQTPPTVHRHPVRADSPLEIELTGLLAV